MALNYAEQWSPELLEILMQGTLTSPFVTSNVRWLDAKSNTTQTGIVTDSVNQVNSRDYRSLFHLRESFGSLPLL